MIRRLRPILLAPVLLPMLLTAAACDRQGSAPAVADNGVAVDERVTLDAEVQALAAQARADAEANALAAQEDLAANLLANASVPPAAPDLADPARVDEAVPAPAPLAPLPPPLPPARLAPPSEDELKAAEASVAAAMEKRRARE